MWQPWSWWLPSSSQLMRVGGLMPAPNPAFEPSGGFSWSCHESRCKSHGRASMRMHGGPKRGRSSLVTTQTMTRARLCWLCSNQAGDLWCFLCSGTFPRAVSATGAISPPAPLRLMGQPMHPHLGDARGHRRASGRAGSWAQAPVAQPAPAPARSLTPSDPS